MISAGFHRTLLWAFLLVLPALTLSAPAVEAREKPVQFMQRAANELVRASRIGQRA